MVESRKMKFGVIALLAVIILAIGLVGLSCVRGATAVGWSGGTVANNVLYVGSNEGKLVAIDLTSITSDTKIKLKPSETLAFKTQNNFLGCSSSSGCGGGTSVVPIYGTPVILNDLVYVAGYNGKIYAFNVADNKTDTLSRRWVYPPENNIFLQSFVGGLVIADGKLFIGCSDGKVISLDALTGDKLAEYKTGDKIWGTPAVANGVLYIGSFDKYLYALNTADLTLKWKYKTEGSIISTPLIDNGVVYFGSFDKNLYALNAADGTVKWKFTGDKWFWAQPQIIDGTIYAGCLDDYVYVLNAADGNQITKFNLNSPVAATPIVSGNYIVFASHNGLIFKIDLTTREIKQVDDLKINVDGPLTAYQGVVYIHPQDTALFRINIENDAILPAISLQS